MAVVLSGCSGSTPDQVFTGVVTSVDGPGVAQVDKIKMHLYSGSTIELTVGTLELTNGGLPAPHLREHLASGEGITAYARNYVMYRYTDAAE